MTKPDTYSRLITLLDEPPADLRKEGASFDLPIALGILAATGSAKPDAIGPFAVVGELALDGQIHAVRGTLAVSLACRRKSIPTILVPAGNRAEALFPHRRLRNLRCVAGAWHR
jgi:predicted ATPase with chaperone activity